MLEESNSNDAFPAEGETFAERYEIGPLLGVGGFANVYRATQVDIDRDVAIKILAPERVGHTEGLNTAERRFYREARLLSKLEGPNTIRLYDYGRTADGLLFTVFEYIDGTELDVLLARHGPFDQERAVHILEQILRSLHEAHSYDILHRDVKPSNVLVYNRLGEPDQVKLLDFGIAKMVAAEARGDEPLTRTGLVVGTPKYMSPEQAVDRPLGPPSDLFSAGLIFYEMLVGNSPYDSSSLTSIRDRIMSAPIRIPRGVDLAPDIREIGNRLLERDVEDRYQNASEVLSALGVEFTESDDSSSPRPLPTNEVSFPISLDTSGVAPVDDLTDASSSTAAEREIDSPDTAEIAAANGDNSKNYSPGETIVDPSAGPPPTNAIDREEFTGHDKKTAVIEPVDDGSEQASAAPVPSDDRRDAASPPRSRPGSASAPPVADRSHITGAAIGAGLAIIILGVWAYSGLDQSESAQARSTNTAGARTSDRSPATQKQGSTGTSDRARSGSSVVDESAAGRRAEESGPSELSIAKRRSRLRAVREASREIDSAFSAGEVRTRRKAEQQRAQRRNEAESSDDEVDSQPVASQSESATPTESKGDSRDQPEPEPEPAPSSASETSSDGPDERRPSSGASSDREESSGSDEIKPIDEYLE